MDNKNIAEMAVKDIAAAKETRTDFENALPFGNTPINLDTPEASDMPEYRKEYSFEYNGKKIAGGWFNDESAHSFAQGMALGIKAFRSTAKIAVYTMNPRRLEWMQA